MAFSEAYPFVASGLQGWTPTIVPSSGSWNTSATISYASFLTFGTAVLFMLRFQQGAEGTGSGAITFTLPVPALSPSAFSAFSESTFTGLACYVPFSAVPASVASFNKDDGSYPGVTGNYYTISGFYNAAGSTS